MKSTTIALAAGTAVAGAALSLRALMRHRVTAALPVPTPNLQLRVPGFPVLERITGRVDPAQPMPLVLVLHGIGGSEEQLVPYTNVKVPARPVYVRGPVPNGTGPNAGYSYFKARFTAAGFMAEVEAMAAQIIRVADTIASQRAVTRTLVLGYSQGGHVAWLLAATGRFDVVVPVSGALAPGYQPPPPTGITTAERMQMEREGLVITKQAMWDQEDVLAAQPLDEDDQRRQVRGAPHTPPAFGRSMTARVDQSQPRTLYAAA